MENESDIILNISNAFDGVRDVIRRYLVKYQCHVIEQREIEEIDDVCQKIQTVFQIMNWENSQFDNIYIQLKELIKKGNQYDISKFICTVMMEELIQCSDDLKDMLNDQIDKRDKRRIRIKFVDFYGGFNPREHWLYKLLETKYNIEESDTPDYLFFSCFGNSFLRYDCIRIFISNEAVYPNLNLYDYAITYSDFKVTDRVLPNQDAFEDLKFKTMVDSRAKAEELLNKKKKFCNFVYSNEYGDPFRKKLFEEISKYKIVTAGGKFLNNIGYLIENLEDFQSEFKFSIACENSSYRGYTTEKIINAFNAQTIPIYWGNEDVSKIINSKAIINCHDFVSIEDIVEEIKRLDNDDEAYLQKLSEPILVDDEMPQKYIEERKKFIFNILDQPYEKAIRRNTSLRGQWYNDWFCYALGYRQEWFTPEKGYFVKPKE